MTSPLANLEPKQLWSHFDRLRQIPRPSRQEQLAVEHVKRWADEHKFGLRQDAVGNICIVVPATSGHEAAKPVILQAHIDMVAEKDKATVFDFAKDPIPVRVDGDWVVAEHTTLGADNGIGVAAAMATADDPSVVHGPLELLFTIDEETGLTGASDLDPQILRGRTLLNLDSEEEETLFVGCAGGGTTEIAVKLTRASDTQGRVPLRVEVAGLKGGHSGLVIHENRGNSIKILGRVLERWREKGDLLIDSMEGGNKHNAIPREASAVVLVAKSFVDQARSIAEDVRRKTLTEIASIDPDLTIKVDPVVDPIPKPATVESSRRLLQLLLALPHGVVAMSRDMPGLTESSTTLAIIRTEGDTVTITSSSRSSVQAALRFVLDQVSAVVALAGATSKEYGIYPGWQPNMNSPLLKICREVHREALGKEAKITAIHAGLECGIIGEKLGGADMISFGPEIRGVHAPGERVSIPSVARFWKFHKALVQRLA